MPAAAQHLLLFAVVVVVVMVAVGSVTNRALNNCHVDNNTRNFCMCPDHIFFDTEYRLD